jgi:predicted murein hydrolase (TIGR00659 family)
MLQLTTSPIFGVLISLVAYIIGQWLNKKTKISLLNPLFIAITLVIIFLIAFNIPLDNYSNGGKVISFFLGPATVILAVPLYNKIDHLKKNAIPIIIGILLGSVAGIITVLFLGRALNLDEVIALSLVPKSVTTPIGIEISNQINGISSVTVTAIIITGILGAIFSPIILKLFKVKDKIAIGVAIGTSSHALGTTKAVELGETEGAMSSLSIGIAGIITVIIAPILIKLFL